jgi:hypothetical protein
MSAAVKPAAVKSRYEMVVLQFNQPCASQWDSFRPDQLYQMERWMAEEFITAGLAAEVEEDAEAPAGVPANPSSK